MKISILYAELSAEYEYINVQLRSKINFSGLSSEIKSNTKHSP